MITEDIPKQLEYLRLTGKHNNNAYHRLRWSRLKYVRQRARHDFEFIVIVDRFGRVFWQSIFIITDLDLMEYKRLSVDISPRVHY